MLIALSTCIPLPTRRRSRLWRLGSNVCHPDPAIEAPVISLSLEVKSNTNITARVAPQENNDHIYILVRVYFSSLCRFIRMYKVLYDTNVKGK